MSDMMSWSSAVDSFFTKLSFVFTIGLFIFLAITISIIATIIFIKIVDKKDPNGNAKRIKKQKIIAVLTGILIISVFNLIPFEIFSISIITRIVIVIMSCIFGPIAGCIIGFFGFMIGALIQGSSSYFMQIGYNALYWLKSNYFFIPMSVYGFIIGIVWQRCVSDANKIHIQSIIIFCIILLFCNILYESLLSIPYLDHFIRYLKEYIIYYPIEIIIIGGILYLYTRVKKNGVRPHVI